MTGSEGALFLGTRGLSCVSAQLICSLSPGQEEERSGLVRWMFSNELPVSSLLLSEIIVSVLRFLLCFAALAVLELNM